MGAYYNEKDRFAACWLRELISKGHIAPGDVDERSIEEVDPQDVKGYTQVHLFAGIGGWSHALRLAGVSDEFAVWTGSCPCQPFSQAGKRKALSDARHLWPEMRRPPACFGEQVASRLGRSWLGSVRTDLEELGYGVGAADLCASGVGAPHIRQRLYWGACRLADGDGAGLEILGQQPTRKKRQTAERNGPSSKSPWGGAEWLPLSDGTLRPTQPGLFPLAHGVPGRVGRLRAYGNAIVPQVAAVFVKAFLTAKNDASI